MLKYSVVDERGDVEAECTSRDAMLAEEGHEGDEEEVAPREMPKRYKAAAITAMILVVCAVAFYMTSPCRNPLSLFRRSSNIQLAEAAQLEAASRHLKSVSSREEADKMVKEAMQKAKEERIEHHKNTKLPPLRSMVGSYYSSGLGQFFEAEKLAGQARKNEADDIVWTAKEKAKFWGGSKMNTNDAFRQAFCVFNVAETVDSLGGTGIDVESMVRTCPEPRNDISDFACAVNAETLAEMVGTAATWLSSAVSTCNTFPNVQADCAAGVGGIVGALGEVAASGTLAMTSCKEFPLAGFKADSYSADARVNIEGEPAVRISQVGAREPGRRLFMGSGIGGTGVQCGVDVGFIADNIYDTVFYIHRAIQLDSCRKRVRYGAYNYLTGVPEAACALDIAGAIAWMTQIATFVQQLISHCPDILELPTLCGSSITGLASSASQIASWGSQIAIACGESESVNLISRVIVFAEDYSLVDGREIAFVKLCSVAMRSFDVQCTWLSLANADDFGGRHLPQVTLVGPYEGLLLADAEIQKNGLDLPGFDPLTYEDTIFRPHGTGVRRLEQEMEQETNDEAEAKAEKKWDPENHPSMRNLRVAMKELQKIRQNLTEPHDGTDEVSASNRATQASLKERLHLIEPALHEYSSKWLSKNLTLAELIFETQKIRHVHFKSANNWPKLGV